MIGIVLAAAVGLSDPELTRPLEVARMPGLPTPRQLGLRVRPLAEKSRALLLKMRAMRADLEAKGNPADREKIELLKKLENDQEYLVRRFESDYR